MPLQVTDSDNRGTQEVPFGFVYFSDDRRVAYTGSGVVADATGGWGPVTSDHVRLAEQYLVELHVLTP